VEVEKKDYTWFFVFSGPITLSIDSAWRLITKDGIVVTSDDHGQQFGLKEPVDAGERVMIATKQKKVFAYRIAERTSDLLLQFEDDVLLEFLNMSCGYESWSVDHGVSRIICLGGGELAILQQKEEV
jgi:hypothetical protein